MVPTNRTRPQAGFSLVEMMLVLVIFLVVSGAIFGLLNVAQARYRSEQEFVDTFQGTRLAIDQVSREIRMAGYPPPSSYAGPPFPVPADPLTAPPDWQRRFSVGFVGWPTQSCTLGVTCALPGGWDLVVEADLDPEREIAAGPPLDPTEQVEWIRYVLVPDAGGQTSTLMRAVVPKVAGADPIAATNAVLSPFVEGVLNQPGVVGDEIFRYVCEAGMAVCSPQNIVEVQIVVRARPMRRDIETRQYREVTLQGVARRVNPYP